MKTKIIVMIVCILAIGCSMNRYMVADQYLERKDFESALQEYIRIAEMGSSLAMSRNVRALTGAMMAYYNLGKYKNSFALSKRILSLEKFNSTAIFYAGMNLEMLNKKSLAKKIYAYFKVLSPGDPYYKFIRAKFDQLLQEELEKRAQLAIQMENNISEGQASDNTTAVLYFLNVLDDTEWNSLSKGLAEMMITDLSQVQKLKVLERLFIEKLFEEMQLGMSGLADESTAPRVGRLLKARSLVNGAFTIKSGQNLTITSNLVDIVVSSSQSPMQFSGELKDIFEMEKKIVFGVIEEMGIQLTAEERKKIGTFATKNFEAFRAYCNGLDKYDFGDYKSASYYFQQAIKLDPSFMLARDMFNMTDALVSLETGNLPSIKYAYAEANYALTTSRVAEFATQSRLNQISQNLDLGYLPGAESRNGSSDIISQDWFWDGDWGKLEILDPPPPPPIPPN